MLKKTIAILLAVLTLIAGFSTNPQNARAVDTVTVIVDGRTVDFPDAPAYVDENGRTQLPARYIGEALGAHVAWDSAANKVTISRRSELWGETHVTATFIDFFIGSDVYYTRIGEDGKNTKLTMDTKAVIEQDRTYVPVRYVAETLGAQVDWNGRTKTVTITSETKVIGDFVVPRSYTDDAKKLNLENGIKLTQFYIQKIEGTSGYTQFSNRIQITFDILMQKLEQDTINELGEYILNGKAFSHKDEYGRIEYEIIFDVKSGQYVELAMHGRTIWINVYDKGCIPTY